MTHLPTLFKFRASESCIWFGTASVTPFKEGGRGGGEKKKRPVLMLQKWRRKLWSQVSRTGGTRNARLLELRRRLKVKSKLKDWKTELQPSTGLFGVLQEADEETGHGWRRRGLGFPTQSWDQSRWNGKLIPDTCSPHTPSTVVTPPRIHHQT